jgi:hypothetical protein
LNNKKLSKEGPEPVPLELLASQTGRDSLDEAATLEQVANATTKGSSPDQEPFSLQSNFGNAAVARALVDRGTGEDSPLISGRAKGLPAAAAMSVLEQPAPAPAPAITATGTKSFDDIKKILETIPTGKAALKTMADLKIEAKFVKGAGCYFDPITDTMILDPDYTLNMLAMAFVHEMNHATARAKSIKGNLKSLSQAEIATKMTAGNVAELKTLSRDAYIKNRVNEEAEGVVKSIEAKIELEGMKVDLSKDEFPLEKDYRDAYKLGVNDARKTHPMFSDVGLRDFGREAGKQAVIKGFMDGKVVTSNSKETYGSYYGKDWDRFHPAK